MSRDRSSSRCSTRLTLSSWRRRRGSRAIVLLAGDPLALLGLRLGLSVRRARRGRSGLRQLRLLELVVAVVARNRVLELPHTAAERTAHLRQPLGPEDEQENENDHYGAGPPDVCWHCGEDSTVGEPEGLEPGPLHWVLRGLQESCSPQM